MKEKITPLLIIILSLLSRSASFSQTPEKDSLLQILKTGPEDTGKVHAYIEYGKLLQPSDPDSAGWYFQKAGALSDRLDYLEGQFSFISNYTNILYNNGKLDEAIRLNKRAIAIATTTHSSSDLAIAYNNLASSYNYKGLYDSAIAYYLKSAGLFEEMSTRKYLPIIYSNVSALFAALEEYSKAVRYSRKAIDISRAINDSIDLCTSLINASGNLVSLNQYDKALELMNEGLEIARRINNKYYLTVGLVNKGDALYKTGRIDEGIRTYREALKVSREIDHQSGLANSLSGLAQGYLEKKDYRKADQYMSEAISMSKKNGYFTDLKGQLKKMAEIKFRLKDFAGAYNNLAEFTVLNDSLTGVSLKKSIDSLEIQFQSVKKDKEITEQKLQLEKNRAAILRKNNWLIVAGTLLCMLILVSLLIFRGHRQKQKLQEQTIITLQKEQEVIRLKSQMEGREKERKRIAREMHDDIGAGLTSMLYLTNGINIHDEAAKQRFQKINYHASTLVDMLNEIIWAANRDYDSLEDLVAYIRQHISEILEPAGMDLKLDAEDIPMSMKLSGEARRNIYLVIKEAVHNSIKHAGASQVNIHFHCNAHLKIDISDNGKGIELDHLRYFGNGLKNMRQRMENAGGDFAIAAQNGTIITLTLPLQQLHEGTGT